MPATKKPAARTAAKTFKKDLTQKGISQTFRVSVIVKTDPTSWVFRQAGATATAKSVGDGLGDNYLWGDFGYLLQTIEVEELPTEK